MTARLVALAFAMWAVTYPVRALPLLAPGVERLPPSVLAYLRLVGPAVLTALAAVNVLVLVRADGSRGLHAGVEALGVLACVALVIWRRNLLLGLAAAVVLTVLLRWTLI